MADKNTTIDVSPAEIISDLPHWTTQPETVRYAFLIMMCQALQDKMIAYYKAGTSDVDRATRLKDIRDKLTTIRFEGVSGQYFSIAPMNGQCLGGEKPVDGVCMNTR
jgi:hypothetical protein